MRLSSLIDSCAPRSTILVRLLVGWVFLSEGIQKILFPATLGVGRFKKIGIPAAHFFAPFVGVVEIVCGTLLIVGLLASLADFAFLVNISVGIILITIPNLQQDGFCASL